MAHPSLTEYFFDKEGAPISPERWGELFGDMAYRRVGLDEFDDGTNISTVWLGIPHGYDPMGPLVFETMVFKANGEDETYRYPTLERAIAGHALRVADVREEQGLPEAIETEATNKPPSRWEQIAKELNEE